MSDYTEENETTEAPQSDAPAIFEEVNPDLTQIEAYAKAKQAIARDLHYIRELLEKRNSEGRHTVCRDLLVKLAEDHFTLAVLGQFKRGKSSLMNAIIGQPLLPTGVLPLTSAITVLRFGPQERLMIEHEGSTVVSEVRISELAHYVTERGNPGNRMRISRAIIEIPSPFLRRGLEFVDTPGVGSAIEANTAITTAFLPQCDAVIFITSVDSPLSQTETEFLSRIREHVRKVFFVVNKIDLVVGDEREEVLRFIYDNIRSTMETEGVRVFPLSCQDGLAARVRGDLEGYTRSGVKSLEEALSGFLTTQRTGAFLVSVLNRAVAITEEELREMEVEARSAQLPEEEARENLAALQRRLEDIRALREHDLSDIQERVLESIGNEARREANAVVEPAREALQAELDRALAGRQWRLSYGVLRDLQAEQVRHINASLDDWTAAAVERLWPLFETSLQQELGALSVRLQEIPEAAAEILGFDAVSSEAPPEFGEFQIERYSRSTSPRRLQPQPGLLPKLGFLPVLLTRGSLARRYRQQIQQMLSAAETAVCEAVMARAEEIQEKTVARFRKAGSELEERVKATVVGKLHASSSAEDRESQFQRLTELRARLCFLRDRIVQSESSETDGIVSLPVLSEADVPQKTAASPEPAPVTTGMAPDFRTRGCPVCDRVHKAMFDFFAHWQYELSSNETSQARFASDGGFCRLHTWQLAGIASPQGISQGYPPLVGRIAGEIARLAGGNGDPAKGVSSLIQDSQHCRACQELRTAEASCLGRFVELIQKPTGVDAYNRSQGVCLRHLAMLMEHDLPQDVRGFLLRHTSQVLSSTVEDMHSYTLKRDALRRGLHNQDEEDAHRRALTRLAGESYLAAPDS